MRYVTPAPGRTQGANIVDRAEYKLDMKVAEFRPEQFVLTIETFISEHGWTSRQYFLTPDELDRVQNALNAIK